MQPQINPDHQRSFFNRTYTERDLRKLKQSDLKALYNSVWDYLDSEHDSLSIKRRRKWKSQEEAVESTWMILGIAIGEVQMADKETKTEKPTPKCYSAEVVKRPTRKMFQRIKKVGEPDKSQRPFAWGDFKDGMRLIDIKEDENLHAGKISFWMRQDPPLIKLEDIDDETYAKERAAWYKKHGLTDPDAAKEAKRKEREEAKAKRAAEREAKAKEREAAKAEKAKAAAEKKAAKEAEKAAKAKAKAEAKPAKSAPAAKKQANAA